MKDPEIRALLRPLLIAGVHIDELNCGGTRSDIVHVHPDFLHGYEIKSDGDDLLRVESQLAAYGHAYDYVTFVITEKHLARITPMLPDWVGITKATLGGLTVIRAADKNPVQARGGVMGLLAAADIKAFLKARGENGHSKKRNWELFGLLNSIEHIALAEIGQYVRERLVEHLPARLRKREADKLFKATEKERAERASDAVALAQASAIGAHFLVEGFPAYRFDGNSNTLLRLTAPDARGHRRDARVIKQTSHNASGGWRLRRNGVNIWVGKAAMKALLRPA